jgi:drug/metabolite transporter (DMT)-like permease
MQLCCKQGHASAWPFSMNGLYHPKMAKKRTVWLEFAALCILSGSTWMIDQSFPQVLSGPVRVAVQDGVLALIFAIATRVQGVQVWLSPKQWLELALAGAGLLAVPSIVSAGASGVVSDFDGILCYTLVPAIVVFLAGQSSLGFGGEESPLRLLVPALAGVGGAALILPSNIPYTLAGKVWLVALIASAAISAYAAIRLHRVLAGASLLQQCAILCAAASVLAAIFYHVDYAPIDSVTGSALTVEALRTLFLDGPLLLLFVYLLREMPPIGISTRMLLIPLITIVESYAIERPSVAWTTYAGVVLMGASAFILLRAEEPGDTRPVSDPSL